MRKILFGFIVLLFLLPMPKSQAATFPVSNDVDLIAAIIAANSNNADDLISLDADISLTSAYVELDPSIPTDGVNGLPSILSDSGSSLTIEGNGHRIFRSGAATFRLMHIATGANVFINDLTLENGMANAGGLGTLGGAIYAVSATLTIDNSIFTANTAVGNSGLGGGIFMNQSTLNLSNSSFTNNVAGASGGAFYNYQNTATLIGNTFYNNSTASIGGAIATEGGTISLINNTISGNTANWQGGGISNSANAIMTMRNNTISNNTAGTWAGGVYNSFFGTVTLHNNIIAGNSAPFNDECYNDTNFGGTVMNGNSNNVFGTGGLAGGCPNGINDIVPVVGIGMILDPLANNGGSTLTHALILGSPAIDAANNSNCPSTDQRGLLRGFDGDGAVDFPELGDCDSGAFEYSLDPAYGSNPAVGASINLGSTPVGTEISTILEVSEVGQAALSVSLTSITGANAADFSIIGLPTIIGDGNAPQDLAIICAPSGAGLRTATITFATNDPTQPSVSYDLECTGTDSLVASASLLGINQIVTEDLTTLNLTVQLDVPAGFSAAGDVTVEIVDAATGNATSGTDYTAFPPTTLTFTGPLTAAASPYTQTVAVAILEDTTTEGAEALALQINAVTGAAEIAPSDSFTIVINDDDGIFAQASFVTNSVLVDEDEVTGTLSFDVQLFIPSGYSQTGDITLTISDSLTGTATSGADYGAFAPVTLTFVDAPFSIGTTYTQTVTVPILDDTLSEGAETFELAISGISGFVELLSPSFTGIINDDEIATLIVTRDGETITVTTGGGDTDFVFKTVDNPFATVGQTVTYSIRARNPKSIPLSQVVIYDVFDERLTDIRLLSTTHGAGTFNGNTLTVSGFSLQPNEEALIVVSARIASLRSGDIIPNAAILESPDASVHVSNLATVGGNPDANSGGAAQVFIVPSQLPNTGETPFWAIGAMLGLALLGVGMGFFVLKNRRAKA